MNTVEKGRQYEFRTAMILWGRFGIPTFPSADSTADLLTANGLALEVKYSAKCYWQLNPRQRHGDFFDFLILWSNTDVFVVPYSPQLWDRLENLKTTSVSLGDVQGWENAWELIADAERS